MNGDDASEEILKTVGLPLVDPVPAVDDTHPDDTKISLNQWEWFYSLEASAVQSMYFVGTSKLIQGK